MDFKKRGHELVPPDGGWGYMIIVATIIIYTTTVTFGPCFGIIFNDFLKQIHMESTTLTLMSGTQGLLISIVSFLTGHMLETISKRKIVLLAATLLTLGTLGTAFTNSILSFFICWGLIFSCGCGLLFNTLHTVINDYFSKKRLFAISLTQTVPAAIGLTVPSLVKWSLSEYGFRGTVIMMTAVSLHIFVGAALLQPVSWHMKKVTYIINDKKTSQEMKVLLDDNSENISIKPAVKSTDIISTPTNSLPEDLLSTTKNRTGIKKSIVAFFKSYADLKPFFLSNASISPMLCMTAEMNFVLLFPQCLYAFGWNENMVTLAVTLSNIGDFLTKIVLIIFNDWLSKFNNNELYIAGLIIAVITRIGMLVSNSYTVALIFITITGVSRCSIILLLPLVISDAVTPDKFSRAMGTAMLVSGVFSFVLGPALGAVRDFTNSYTTVFCILTLLHCIVIIIWSTEIYYKKRKQKKQETKL